MMIFTKNDLKKVSKLVWNIFKYIMKISFEMKKDAWFRCFLNFSVHMNIFSKHSQTCFWCYRNLKKEQLYIGWIFKFFTWSLYILFLWQVFTSIHIKRNAWAWPITQIEALPLELSTVSHAALKILIGHHNRVCDC